MMLGSDYYSLTNIKSKKAQYNVVFGERSNGKSFAILEEMVINYFNNGKQGAYVRRYDTDFKSKRGQQVFSALVNAGKIKKYSGGVWSDVYYYAGRWFFKRVEEDEKGKEKIIKSDEPFCFAFALSTMEHDKSTSYPNITTIFLDEFISKSRQGYLVDEFIIFQNVISTIKRDRDDVTIYMAGNTVNKFNPYFSEMGLTHASKMEQGTIDVYTYGDSGLRVAVEYCANRKKKSKAADDYFAFNNPKLKMITSGLWEIEPYPHLQKKYTRSNIVLTFYVKFKTYLFAGDVVVIGSDIFVFLHEKTSELKDLNTDIIFCDTIDYNYNHFYGFYGYNKVTSKIVELYEKNKFFYQSNDVGDVFANFINQCK